MKNLFFFFFLVGAILCPILNRAHAQDKKDFEKFEKKAFIFRNADTLLYRILYPEKYDPKKKYPLVVFLHGAGERGNDNKKQLTHGAALFLEENNRKNFPAIVVFPQCPKDKYWIDISVREELFGKGDPNFSQSIDSPSRQLDMVNALTKQLIKKEKIDTKRLYIMGLSMGGFGAFETLGRWPKKYAGAIAICGGGNLALAKKHAPHTAVWITHGAQDDVVPIALSRRVYEVLDNLDADVLFTEFPEANHNAWDSTFAIPDLLPWLFSKHK